MYIAVYIYIWCYEIGIKNKQALNAVMPNEKKTTTNIFTYGNRYGNTGRMQ